MKQTTALRDLIDDTMTKNGWTLADVATRAQRAGHDLSPQNISRIKKGPTVNLVAKQVRALAAGLGVPVDAVIDANLRAMGFEIHSGGSLTAWEAIKVDPSLTERDRRLLLATMRELEAARDAGRIAERLDDVQSRLLRAIRQRHSEVGPRAATSLAEAYARWVTTDDDSRDLAPEKMVERALEMMSGLFVESKPAPRTLSVATATIHELPDAADDAGGCDHEDEDEHREEEP